MTSPLSRTGSGAPELALPIAAAPDRPSPGPGGQRRGLVREAAAAGGILAVLAALLMEHAWITRTGTVIGLGYDPDLFMWYLRWTPWAISHGQDPLVTDHLIAPDGANLMWNTSIILPSFVLWPVTALVGPQWSYDVLMTAAPALSGWVAYLALRRHASWLGAMAGAVLYGFSPELVVQSNGHPMVTIAVFPPLTMILLEEMVTSTSRRRRLVSGAFLGAASAAQLLTGTEMLALTVISAGVGLGVLAALNPAETRARALGVLEGLAAAMVAGVVLGAFPLAIALAGPQHVNGVLQAPDVYVQDVIDLVVPGPNQAVAPDRAVQIASAITGNTAESGGYLGIPLLVVTAVAARAMWRRRAARWAAVSAGLVVVLALGPHLHVGGTVLHVPLPWQFLGGRSLLVSLLPGRFMIIAYLPLALLLAIGIDAVRAHRRVAVKLLAAAGAGLVMISLLPRPIAAGSRSTAAFFTSSDVARIPESSIVLVSPGLVDYSAMLDQAAADMRFRIPTGGVFVPGPRFGPPEPSALYDELRAAESSDAWVLPPPSRLAAVRAELRMTGARAVVVAPQAHMSDVAALMAAVLGSPPVPIGGVDFWSLPGA